MPTNPITNIPSFPAPPTTDAKKKYPWSEPEAAPYRWAQPTVEEMRKAPWYSRPLVPVSFGQAAGEYAHKYLDFQLPPELQGLPAPPAESGIGGALTKTGKGITSGMAGVIHGAGELIDSINTPIGLTSLIGFTAVTGLAPGIATGLIKAATKLGLSLGALQDAIVRSPEAQQAFAAGDIEEGFKQLTHLTADAGAFVYGGKGAAKDLAPAWAKGGEGGFVDLTPGKRYYTREGRRTTVNDPYKIDRMLKEGKLLTQEEFDMMQAAKRMVAHGAEPAAGLTQAKVELPKEVVTPAAPSKPAAPAQAAPSSAGSLSIADKLRFTAEISSNPHMSDAMKQGALNELWKVEGAAEPVAPAVPPQTAPQKITPPAAATNEVVAEPPVPTPTPPPAMPAAPTPSTPLATMGAPEVSEAPPVEPDYASMTPHPSIKQPKQDFRSMRRVVDGKLTTVVGDVSKVTQPRKKFEPAPKPQYPYKEIEKAPTLPNTPEELNELPPEVRKNITIKGFGTNPTYDPQSGFISVVDHMGKQQLISPSRIQWGVSSGTGSMKLLTVKDSAIKDLVRLKSSDGVANRFKLETLDKKETDTLLSQLRKKGDSASLEEARVIEQNRDPETGGVTRHHVTLTKDAPRITAQHLGPEGTPASKLATDKMFRELGLTEDAPNIPPPPETSTRALESDFTPNVTEEAAPQVAKTVEKALNIGGSRVFRTVRDQQLRAQARDLLKSWKEDPSTIDYEKLAELAKDPENTGAQQFVKNLGLPKGWDKRNIPKGIREYYPQRKIVLYDSELKPMQPEATGDTGRQPSRFVSKVQTDAEAEVVDRMSAGTPPGEPVGMQHVRVPERIKMENVNTEMYAKGGTTGRAKLWMEKAHTILEPGAPYTTFKPPMYDKSGALISPKGNIGIQWQGGPNEFGGLQNVDWWPANREVSIPSYTKIPAGRLVDITKPIAPPEGVRQPYTDPMSGAKVTQLDFTQTTPAQGVDATTLLRRQLQEKLKFWEAKENALGYRLRQAEELRTKLNKSYSFSVASPTPPPTRK